jgi:hypothetical protein
MSAEVVRRMFQVFLRPSKRRNRFPDFRMRLRRIGRRGIRRARRRHRNPLRIRRSRSYRRKSYRKHKRRRDNQPNHLRFHGPFLSPDFRLGQTKSHSAPPSASRRRKSSRLTVRWPSRMN